MINPNVHAKAVEEKENLCREVAIKNASIEMLQDMVKDLQRELARYKEKYGQIPPEGITWER